MLTDGVGNGDGTLADSHITSKRPQTSTVSLSGFLLRRMDCILYLPLKCRDDFPVFGDVNRKWQSEHSKFGRYLLP